MIDILPLKQNLYAPYGDVICTRRDESKPKSANLGTAVRYDFLADLKNLRGDAAKVNVCVFECLPMVSPSDETFRVRLLEKHQESSQMFVPMNGAGKYLVVVCLGDTLPDLATLKVFLAEPGQGITYHPGVWHHPLIAMHQPSNFSCIVWEDGGQGDCVTCKIDPPIQIDV